MEGEAGILQDRIEIAALERRIGDAQERIRGGENEQLEGGRDPGLHRQHVGLSVTGRLLPNAATSAPNNARISTHSSIEPSWLPQTLVSS